MTYVSSPYESHFGDEGDHGWTFYDTDKDYIEFIPNLNSPRFVIHELTSGNMKKINEIKNSFIKLLIKKNIDSSLLIQYREKLLKNGNFDPSRLAGTWVSIKGNWYNNIYLKSLNHAQNYAPGSTGEAFTGPGNKGLILSFPPKLDASVNTQ